MLKCCMWQPKLNAHGEMRKHLANLCKRRKIKAEMRNKPNATNTHTSYFLPCPLLDYFEWGGKMLIGLQLLFC